MSGSPDITVILVCHREGPLAVSSLASMREMVDKARLAGLRVETRAVLDRADELTRHTVSVCGAWLDAIQEISAGDLGLARNAGAAVAAGEFLAFLDGDDLWGADWLRLAHASAIAPEAPEAVWHPSFLYYFDQDDFDRRAATETATNPSLKSFYLVHQSSTDPDFKRDSLFLDNVWSANVFASRAIHLGFPYVAADRDRGFGFEDWTWNIHTLTSGVPHLVVPDTVHLIRIKQSDSLGKQSVAEGLLPLLPDEASPQFGAV